MYSLDQIRRVGFVYIGGAVAVSLAGFLTEVFVTGGQNVWVGILGSHLITLAVFGLGWFMFSQIVVGQTYGNVVNGRTFNGQPMERLKQIPDPPRRFGMDYFMVEVTAMVLAVVLVILVTALVGKSSGFPLAGFAGGWLLGGGFGRLRFPNKVHKQELEQERTFYFSDTSAGPRTDVAFYEEKPGKRTLEENRLSPEKIVKTTTETALPPGVRRRAETGSAAGGKGSPTRKQAKATPLIPTSKTQPKNKTGNENQ
jgi:hypothetical protein